MVKKRIKKTIIAFLLLFVGFGLQAQDMNETTVGFVVKPKDYRVNANENVSELEELLVNENTKWGSKNKAYGVYAFNLSDKKIGFFVGDRLIGTGNIIQVDNQKDYVVIIGITLNENRKTILIKYFISLSNKNKFDFVCWWYDEDEDVFKGEVSEKIKIDFVNEGD